MSPLAELETPEQALIARQDAAMLYQAMHRLSARHERVLRLRFGIGCEPLTLKAIGAMFDVSKEGVRQIEIEACRKLRIPLMLKFRERSDAQRFRRELDEKRKVDADARAFEIKQCAINEERAAARLAAERAQVERERQRKSTIAEILRIAEEVELELDHIPRRPRQREVNPFGFSSEKAAEYAAVLRGMLRV